MKNYLFLFALLFCSLGIFSQAKTIKGTVLDVSGYGLPGVNVVVKGTTTGTMTDVEGGFSFDVETGAKTLVFSSIGYKTKEIEIGEKTNFKVTLEEDAVGLDEVVVTALGIKREKKSLGYAVQNVKSESITAGNNTNIATSLQGKIAGVTVNSAGG
jgi:hypothetical protein